ncbi:MAG: hypothetical protein ABJA89_01945, partial [Lapillicoccus sp.]
MMFPDFLGSTTGRDAVAAGLADEAPRSTFETWEPQPTRDGFLAEYAYRTTATDAQPSALSVGLVAATVSGGWITRLVLTCAARGPVTGRPRSSATRASARRHDDDDPSRRPGRRRLVHHCTGPRLSGAHR